MRCRPPPTCGDLREERRSHPVGDEMAIGEGAWHHAFGELEVWKVCSGAIAAMAGGQSSVSGPQASFSMTWMSNLRTMAASACRRSSLMVPTVGLVADGMTKAAHP